MNYTGRPSISGCRPVLSLYPTHRFCQYLLLIFITFTNSSLFNRAFSTNSRRPFSHASLDKAPKGSPFGGGAQPLRHACGVTPPLPRGGLGIPQSFPSQFKVFLSARGSPTRGAVERSETERLYEGKPDREPLLGSTSPSALTRCHLPYRGEALAFRKVFLPSSKFSSPPEAPLLGELSAKQTERLYEGKPFLCRKVRLLASPVSFWRIICYNGFAALPAHFMGREVKPNGVYFYLYPVRRSECSVLLHLQVA